MGQLSLRIPPIPCLVLDHLPVPILLKIIAVAMFTLGLFVPLTSQIDKLFHSSGYTTAFTNSPLVFGAFPSLHSGAATLEALFLSHFFPQTTKYAWAYAGVLYWATMYLTHHYLVDVVGGACMATAFFHLFLPDELKHPSAATAPPTGLPGNAHAHRMGNQRSKYAIYDLEAPSSASVNRGILSEVAAAADFELSSDDEEDLQEIRCPGSRT
ncbi:Phosphatidylinositol:ceramide phosphoinositol transferase (IPC synthase) [Marasmius crinis-equi]|uniref:Phosphatidylinositol:ceramide phosphoinositol transferase (IPC synthase) n=1 Tax=Marasmius crinis-equi TaxID=585013 RepID=A0ABR3EJR2_9AGAR